MTRMPFLYVEAPPRKPNWLKFALQLVLTGAVLTFCVVVLGR
jgi:hypothetical protein